MFRTAGSNLLLCLAICAGARAEGVWFGELGQPLAAMADDMKAAIPVAVAAVQGETLPVLPARLADDRQARIVFLSASDEQTQARTVMGQGAGFREAIVAAAAALRQAADDESFTQFKLDLVEEVVALPAVDLDYPLQHERSLWGLAFARESQVAFLPEELTGNDIVDVDGVLLLERAVPYMKRHGRPVEGLRPLYRPVDHPLFRFRTASVFWSQATGAIPLYRGHAMLPEASADEMLASAKAGGEYLKRNVDDQGRITYHYFPATGEVLADYNIVRHSGSLAAMYELYAATRDEELLAAAERARAMVLAQVRPVRVNDVDASCVVYDGVTQLGGNAVTIIALARRAEATGDTSDLPVMKHLGSWIEATQEPSGNFGVHRQVYPDGPAEGFKSIYFPGEAVLALCRLYALTGDRHWIESAERGARWIVEVRDIEVPEADQEHDHWLLYGLREIEPLFPRPSYLAHTEKICRSILAIQHLKPKEPDWYGGYYNPPRSTPLATRNEALMCAYEILMRHERRELAEHVLAAMRRGTSFQLQTQYRPESALHFLDPPRILGGFCGGIHDTAIRNDYNQHSISALLGLRKIVTAQN